MFIRRIAALLLPFFAATIAAPAQSPAPATKLVGYFPQWALYNDQRYLAKDLVTSGSIRLLDQINYAQGFVTNGRCSVADPNADLNTVFTAKESVTGRADSPKKPFRGYLHQLAELKRKNPHLRLLISLEGRASDFAYDAQPEHRQAFIDSCVDIFLRGNLAPGIHQPHLFDGIDVDWEYPHGADSANFLALLTELRQRMNQLRPGLTLSIAVGPSPHMYEGVDMSAIARTVDQVGLMTYDFSGPWSDHTGFVAQLASADPDHDGSVRRTVASFIKAGIPAEKLLVGVPFYGYGWRLVPDVANGVEQEGEPIHGDHSYREIAAMASRSKLYRDPVAQTPWLFDGDAFWTFDDPLSVEAKASYAHTEHLGGMMFWELSGDTAEGHLLRAAHEGLRHPTPPKQQQPEPETQNTILSSP
ncbi:MAG: glycosyl hydrolase family 18 protein [Edaphobacter sp.]|uniref:glycoside hydrolase family 18 protein n=1 Tax=Edaphobacter sp. TaxID=1934404 RepID=UPI0023982C1D|nr:glycosyl hydrolase family 18 protein [Edaphobacter sp.]MDE1176826.1 glycosyl hydrolase family 18 protein [Edaphobacter sp.]